MNAVAPSLLHVGERYLAGLFEGAARRSGVRVFRYHGVVESRTDGLLERNQHLFSRFVAQMAYLRRFAVLGLDEILDAVEGPGRAPKAAAAVTFDDGFANNLMVAEVMSRHRLPWILFVPSGELGDGRAMWLNELSLLLLAGDAPRVEALGEVWLLSTREERERAFRRVRSRFKELPAAERRDAMEAVRSQFPPEEPKRLVARFPSLRMMSWAELGQVAAAGVEIGSHGLHHEMHHGRQPGVERVRELEASRRELEARLGRACRAFAFPNGNVVEESSEEAARAGYAAAFTTESSSIRPGASRYLLPRIEAPQSLRRFVRRYWWEEPPQASGLGPAAA